MGSPWKIQTRKWFFRKAKARKRKNEILMLKNDIGEWKSSKDEIHETILAFFGNIFQWNQLNDGNNQWEPPSEVGGLLPEISTC